MESGQRHLVLVGAQQSRFPARLFGSTVLGADEAELREAAQGQDYNLYEGTLPDLLATADAIEEGASQDREHNTTWQRRLVQSLREGCDVTTEEG